MAATRRSSACASGASSSATWLASSRVGARISPRGADAVRGRSPACSRASTARPKASVLPEPVCARPRTSRPARASGNARVWMANGMVKPRRASVVTRASGRPSCAKSRGCGAVCAAAASSRASISETWSRVDGVRVAGPLLRRWWDGRGRRVETRPPLPWVGRGIEVTPDDEGRGVSQADPGSIEMESTHKQRPRGQLARGRDGSCAVSTYNGSSRGKCSRLRWTHRPDLPLPRRLLPVMPSAPAPGRRTTTRLLGAVIVAALAVGTGTLIAEAPWSEAAPARGTQSLPTTTAPLDAQLAQPAAPPATSRNLTGAPTRRSPAGAGPDATRLSTFWGVDVSWPQCNGGIPPLTPGFAVVGVNGGRPFTDNPCLSEQVAYAKGRTGYAAYINLDAPRGEDPRSYGRRSALDGLARARRAGLDVATIWLDVEVLNHWSHDAATNAAVINGAAEALQSRGLTAGIYSSVDMWHDITGGAKVTLPVWLATSVIDYRDVQPLCRDGLGGRPAEMAQYVASANGKLIDINVLCNNVIPDVVTRFTAGAP